MRDKQLVKTKMYKMKVGCCLKVLLRSSQTETTQMVILETKMIVGFERDTRFCCSKSWSYIFET